MAAVYAATDVTWRHQLAKDLEMRLASKPKNLD